MALTSKSDKAEAQGVAGRRSTRLAISVPLTLSGKDAAGHSFKENTRTIIVNKHGAKVSTFHQMALGAEVLIENRALARSVKATVVWLGDRRSPKEPFEVGLQLLEASNIWGIEFPPEDWQEGPPVGTGGQRLEGLPPPPAGVAGEPAPTPPRAAQVGRTTLPAPAKPSEALRPAVARAPTPPAAVGGAPAIPSAMAEASLAQIIRRADALLEERVRAFEERLSQLAHRIGFQTQAQFQDAANRLEEKVVGGVGQRVQEMMTRLEVARADLEELQSQFQQIATWSQEEAERARSNIQNVGFEALQAAIEEMEPKMRPNLEAIAAGFVEQTRRKIEEEAQAVGDLRKQLLEDTRRQLEELRLAAQESMAQKAQSFEREYLEEVRRNLQELQDQRIREFEDHLHKGLEKQRQAVLKQVQKVAEQSTEQAIADARQKIQQAAQAVFDEASNQLSAATFTLGQIQKVAEETPQRATAEIEAKAREACEAASAELSQQLAAASTALKSTEDQTRARLEAQVACDASAALEALRKQMADVSQTAVEDLKKQSEVIWGGIQSRLEEDTAVRERKTSETLETKLRELTERAVEESAAALRKQGEENLELVAEQMAEARTRIVNEAEESLRARMAEIFSSMLHPTPKKPRQP